ncbi:para-aminobenzoate synthetase/4-amino-4-deoxychorismate lyase [Sphingomonas vulcanisoli]|uniref:Probable branched-chain-amino-acid aminotransferase n=1 Tax=Sphingomonas vulcanisoli TaxID=1658060 RepID=A0ABX0TU95_9SPHN|nr:aminodeoxychorismate synthase component I [Sphingomonas vulcanisoli]NIJ09021.1 para-aminobenzoate synthetase/4-amino-4-deoxychorismate lyase [Sphingomonas vulcanisoli]
MPISGPFVLLDDARPGGRQLLLRDPIEIVSADRAGDVPQALNRLREAIGAGRHVAGYLSYDAGAGPSLWFGLFDRDEPFDIAELPDPAGAFCSAAEPSISYEAYAAALAEAQALIAAGEVYQLNLTFPNRVSVGGHPLGLYARLRAEAGAGWGAVVHDGARWLLSFSPELFFRIEGQRIIARPMKGTERRGRSPAEDDALAEALAADPKQRAENLMIVDLLRNDLARVSAPGSVAVPELFAVERYPTVLQMVSGVEAALAPDKDALDALEALFPCGSITGAPKHRAMQAIAAIEQAPRGIYTGAIGAIDPDGDAAFNVAIRTLVIDGEGEASIGLGSGIVADSRAPAEWEECLAKGAFLRAGQPRFDLIETMRFDAEEGLLELERHLARLKASAAALGFRFDRHAARNELHAATFRLRDAARVRLRLARSGALAIESRALPPVPDKPVTVRIAPLPVDHADVRLIHKTSDRGFYDRARRESGCFEVVFVDEEGLLTEGSFTSLFVRRSDGLLVTPPLTRGLLPGVLRAALIAEGEAIEGELRREDLAQGFLIGNALRGLIEARLG